MKGIKYYFVILSLCFGLSLTAQNKVSFLIDDGFWVGVNRSMHLLAKMHPEVAEKCQFKEFIYSNYHESDMDFFENLGSKLNKVGSDASQKVKSLSAITNLKLENSKLEKSLDDMLLNLGQRYFNKFSEAPDAEFADIIGNIKSCKARIDGNLAEIRRLNGNVICPACGAEVSSSSQFCPGCGEKMPAPEVSELTCPACGAAVSEDASFCTKCGASIKKPE